jgi:hypothetical protein
VAVSLSAPAAIYFPGSYTYRNFKSKSKFYLYSPLLGARLYGIFGTANTENTLSTIKVNGTLDFHGMRIYDILWYCDEMTVFYTNALD